MNARRCIPCTSTTRRPRRWIPEWLRSNGRVPDARGSVRQSGLRESRLRRGGGRLGRDGARAGGGCGGRGAGGHHLDLGRHRGEQSGAVRRCPLLPGSGGTSSPRAPNTRPCSIPAANWSGAAGGSPIWFPDRDGVLDPAQVAAALRPDTVLVSLMHVNNEIGVIQDIAAIAAVCAAHGRAASSARGCGAEHRQVRGEFRAIAGSI